MLDDAFRHEVLNQALKGLLAGLGHGSGATRHGTLVSLAAPITPGMDIVAPALVEAMTGRKNGAYVVVASKPVAISGGGLVTVLKYPLPKRRAPKEMLELLLRYAPPNIGPVTLRDAIGADLEEDRGGELVFSLLPFSPNREAHAISERLFERTGVKCDVIITDTSAGWAKGLAIVGAPTLIATPLGMTAGVDFFYAQRMASMAEVLRNEVPLSPYVIVDPPTDRSRQRQNCGHRVDGSFISVTGEESYLS